MKHLIPFRHKHKTTGDTIVEVLIVIAVVSAILTGAFAVANRSSLSVRDAEEHAEAVQYLQGQTELLRDAASRSGGLNFNLSQPFCLDANNHYLATDLTHCQLGSLFDVAIVQNTASSSGTTTTTFDLTATWPGVTGATDKVYLSYRVTIVP